VHLRLFIVAIPLLFSTPVPAATPEDTAEAHRLLREMDKLAAKGAWAGVERSYESLRALEDVEVAVETHLLAASASRQRGDLTETWRRLNRVLELDGLHEDTHIQIATIEATYGEVSLKVHKKWRGEAPLEARDLGFSPEHHTALEKARAALADRREYDGLLPLGRYSLGTELFEVIGGPRVEVLLK